MKVYIAGPITGNPNYKQEFKMAEEILKEKGAIVMNPSVLSEGFTWDEYMPITLAMLSVCDTIALLPGWENSRGSTIEYRTALSTGKTIIEFTSLNSFIDYQLVGRVFTPNKNDH